MLRHCDDCQILTETNELGLCPKCDAAAEAFAKAAAAARARGHDPFTAGMIAQAEITRKENTNVR